MSIDSLTKIDDLLRNLTVIKKRQSKLMRDNAQLLQIAGKQLGNVSSIGAIDIVKEERAPIEMNEDALKTSPRYYHDIENDLYYVPDYSVTRGEKTNRGRFSSYLNPEGGETDVGMTWRFSDFGVSDVNYFALIDVYLLIYDNTGAGYDSTYDVKYQIYKYRGPPESYSDPTDSDLFFTPIEVIYEMRGKMGKVFHYDLSDRPVIYGAHEYTGERLVNEEGLAAGFQARAFKIFLYLKKVTKSEFDAFLRRL